jgi:hypothetical protein
MISTQNAERLQKELNSFGGLWDSGYYEGNPLEPMSRSSYSNMGYMSILHVVYLTCIKPYVNGKSFVLEIGPGRGAWTKTFLHANEVWCLDALSAQHNKFWEYIGKSSNVKYYQVSDFSCSMLPEDKFNYLFSFGTLCHISFEGIHEYMKNLYSKLTKGAHCFISIADYEKYNRSLANIDSLDIINAFLPRKHYKPIRPVLNKLWKLARKHYIDTTRKNPNEDNIPSPGRWYHAGIERTCMMLEELGYEIIDPDIGAVYRDPIIHFLKSHS